MLRFLAATASGLVKSAVFHQRRTVAAITAACIDSGINDTKENNLKGVVTGHYVVGRGITMGSQDNMMHGTKIAQVIRDRAVENEKNHLSENTVPLSPLEIISIKVTDVWFQFENPETGSVIEWGEHPSKSERFSRFGIPDHAVKRLQTPTTQLVCAEAIDLAVSLKVQVINISMGEAGTDSSFSCSSSGAGLERLRDDARYHIGLNAVRRAVHSGITVVVAAGNEGLKGTPMGFYPSSPHVISVGASDAWARKAPFSTEGPTLFGCPAPTIYAFGVDYNVTQGGKKCMDKNQGTSIACAEVTAAVVRLLQEDPNLGPEEIKRILVNSATRMRGSAEGPGLLNIERALEMYENHEY